MNLEIKQPEISIIIVSYNTADLICNCLDSVLSNDGSSIEIIVVDNASTDGSVDLIRGKYENVQVISNIKNVGFAAANNQALPLCSGRYILFLNPDTEVMPHFFENLIQYMDTHHNIGLAGTKIVDTDGTLQWSISYKYPGHRYAKPEISGLPGSIAALLGACMIVRSELITILGGFDEDYFLYGEDQDLCLRIRKSGYKLGYVDDSSIIHIGGQSERKSVPSEVWRKKILAEYVFYKKHYHPDTVAKITRAYLIKSCWRIATLKLLHPFAKDKEGSMENLAKYRAIYQAVKNHKQSTQKEV